MRRMRRGGGLQFGRQRRKVNMPLVKEAMIWALELLIVLGIAFVFVYYIGQCTRVIGGSMAPTLEDGDRILINRFVYLVTNPKHNDVVAFLPNGNEKSHYYVKRVVGVPGDTVMIKEGALYVNGELYEEAIDVSSMDYAGLAEEEITLGKNEYFVLGDNRNNSEDSRYANIGLIKKEHIVGKGWFEISPLSKFGFMK
ncbi:MAG: signal peptidase I [Lachnospiraceae bacterium]|nr:signal peptidase I [Lachnospiraceae bacterium]